ncbi:MAG: tRNA (N6-threonylcarbamoyladenosine(37)-N6)-methyltransferase TrmO [Chloroflexota bacterium]|nr:tRNA (N6-threonylcarbamoyladenosine(37)-N6)-methyltransferase TrmO [Chloroflexota bacterium]MDQ5867808.1 tRNA (N6-threonylcarbamoyladenosine(37)-N6)-methyltransferase TrmO [Chloroflexota bacterium]
MQPIGVVRSPVKEGADEGWGAVVSEIHLLEEYAPGLLGLEEFSHVIVVFLMHQATFNPGDLVRPPRGRDDMPETGIFAQRAKHRPNPIGLTAVRLLSVVGNVLTVRGLDAIDGSPVLDIKPYFAAFDRVDDASAPAWVGSLMEGYF